MEIIIGRDKDTQQLRLTIGNQSKLVGTPGSVPDYVSRQHVKLTTDERGGFVLTNLKATNVTYVNGLSVDSKHVSEKDKIELGPTRFPLDWSFVDQVMPKMVDIRPLEEVWNHYHETKMKYQIAERKFNALRSATGIITMAAMLASLLGGRGPIYYAMYGLAIGITLAFTIKAYIGSSKIPKQNDELDRDFKKRYVCPNPKCNHFLGYSSYDILSQNKNCPYCKAQYRK